MYYIFNRDRHMISEQQKYKNNQNICEKNTNLKKKSFVNNSCAKNPMTNKFCSKKMK